MASKNDTSAAQKEAIVTGQKDPIPLHHVTGNLVLSGLTRLGFGRIQFLLCCICVHGLDKGQRAQTGTQGVPYKHEEELFDSALRRLPVEAVESPVKVFNSRPDWMLSCAMYRREPALAEGN